MVAAQLAQHQKEAQSIAWRIVRATTIPLELPMLSCPPAAFRRHGPSKSKTRALLSAHSGQQLAYVYFEDELLIPRLDPPVFGLAARLESVPFTRKRS